MLSQYLTHVDSLFECPDPHEFADDGRHVGVQRRFLDVGVEHVAHSDEFLSERFHQLLVFVFEMNLQTIVQNKFTLNTSIYHINLLISEIH